nr:MFS sugar transporter [Colletotrichum truncatum]XP_036582396.1 MFS sugar transporter [Colletotrichum truncatum]KAF6780735.1 MFS sugar transporter [Colletotrichum truncatum]KAF6791100.1 MFS sugar transporter [Colletotrichum truncatum]
MVVPLYLSELAPPNLRGSLVALQQLGITVGIMVAFWLDYGTQHIGGTGDTQSPAAWRLPLALQCVPSLVLAAGTFYLPYTPRWLLMKDREEDALATLVRVRRTPPHDPRVRIEILEIMAAVQFDHETNATVYGEMPSHFRLTIEKYKSLFVTRHLNRRLLIACLIQVIQQFTGINAIIYYAPKIFQNIGLSGNSVDLLATGVVGVLNFFSTIPAIMFMDRWGRKKVLIVGGIGMGVSQLIVGTLYAVYKDSWASNKAAGWATAVFVWTYIANFAFSIGCVNWIIPSEIFPPGVRSQAVGLAIGTNWLSNFIVALITPRMLEAIKFGTFYFFLGLRIEEMDKLFGGNQGQEDMNRMDAIRRGLGIGTGGYDVSRKMGNIGADNSRSKRNELIQQMQEMMANLQENIGSLREDGTQAPVETFSSRSPSTELAWIGVEDVKLPIQSLLPTVGVKTAVGEPVPSALCRAAMADPLVFLSVLAGGSSQLCFRTKSVDDQMVLLKAESHVARVVRQELSKGTATISDAVLFGILSMALKQNTYLLSIYPEDRYGGDFRSPVKTLGGLDWLGLIHIVPEHTTMWMYLLRARNRSLSDRIPGVAEYLQSTDLLRASILLEKPKLEMGESFLSLLETEAAAIRPDASEARVFKVNENFREILLDLKLCCRLIHTFHGRIALDSETSKFISYRNLIMYRLLSLPLGQAEICRLTTLIFSYGVIYPLPDPRVIRKLASQLNEAILSRSLTESEDDKFLLWAAVIGGIAAAGTSIYGSFVLEVRRYARSLELREWDSVLDILKEYIWLGKACDAGGKALWMAANPEAVE